MRRRHGDRHRRPLVASSYGEQARPDAKAEEDELRAIGGERKRRESAAARGIAYEKRFLLHARA